MPLGWWHRQTGQFGLTACRQFLHNDYSIIQTKLWNLTARQPAGRPQWRHCQPVPPDWCISHLGGGCPIIINICFPGTLSVHPRTVLMWMLGINLPPLEKTVFCTLGVVIRGIQVFKETPLVDHRALRSNRENYPKWGCPWLLGSVSQRNNFLAICMNLGAVIPMRIIQLEEVEQNLSWI